MRPPIIDVRGQLPRNGTFPTRPLSAVTILAIHYDGVDIDDSVAPLARMQQEAQEHIDRDWGGGAHGHGLEYHYIIERDENIYQAEDEEALTWNAYNANSCDLAIKVTSGPNTAPTPGQIAKAKLLIDWLATARTEIPAGKKDVWGHGELTAYGNATACPGPVMLSWAQAYRAAA